jgi:hypothetical protein
MFAHITFVGVLQHGNKAKWAKYVFTTCYRNINGKIPLIAITTMLDNNDDLFLLACLGVKLVETKMKGQSFFFICSTSFYKHVYSLRSSCWVIKTFSNSYYIRSNSWSTSWYKTSLWIAIFLLSSTIDVAIFNSPFFIYFKL